jgi:tryptophan-rich sensory protein
MEPFQHNRPETTVAIGVGLLYVDFLSVKSIRELFILHNWILPMECIGKTNRTAAYFLHRPHWMSGAPALLPEGQDAMINRAAIDDALAVIRSENSNWRWYHGALFFMLVNGLSAGLERLVTVRSRQRSMLPWQQLKEGPDYFKSQKKAIFAPPAWAFGPAWTINNISVIWGALRVLNMPRDKEGRTAYLALQAGIWLDYVLFSAAYFGLRSPILGACITFLFLAMTIASGLVALFKLQDTKVALSLATVFVWLLIAAPTALFQALWNRDDFYRSGPFAKPPAGWMKK